MESQGDWTTENFVINETKTCVNFFKSTPQSVDIEKFFKLIYSARTLTHSLKERGENVELEIWVTKCFQSFNVSIDSKCFERTNK